MNTRSKRKSLNRRKAEPEVFVLPPNLLEKLGIKLDKIQSKENGSTDSENSIDVVADLEENVHSNIITDIRRKNESESSILETASLMTESVFLSPTFVPTTANMITGEVEIANVIKECENNAESPTQSPVNIESFPVPLSSEHEPTTANMITGEVKIANIIQKCENGTEILTQGPVHIESFPVPLSSEHENTTANMITGEVKIAIMIHECENDTESLTQGPMNIENFPAPLSSDHEPTTANMITSEVEITNIIQECENDTESLTQGTVNIESFPVPLSSEHEPTTVNIITSEVEMANIMQECKNDAESLTQGPVNIESFPVPLNSEHELTKANLITSEVGIANIVKECENDAESLTRGIVNIESFPVLLSSEHEPTTAKMITGEVEIANIIKECENDDESLTQGPVNIESFPVPLSAEHELFKTFESVNTSQNDSIRDVQVPDMCFSEMCDNRKYNKTPDFHDFVDTTNIQNLLSAQKSLISPSTHGLNPKPNENKELRKTKINIINDEIIDMAKLNKMFNFDNNNFFTPVTVDMMLKPAKSYTEPLSFNGLPNRDSNQTNRKDTVTKDDEQGTLSLRNYANSADVTQVSARLNFVNETKSSTLENCYIEVHSDAVTKEFKKITTDQENDTRSKTNSNFIQGCDYKDFPVFTNPVEPFEVNTNQQNKLPSVRSPKNYIEFQEPHIIVERENDTMKKDVNGFDISCNSMTKNYIFRVNKNCHEYHSDKFSESVSNTLSCATSDTANDFENCIRKSKLCIQGVEKPGGQKHTRKPAQVYCNRRKLNKRKSITNKKQTEEFPPSHEYNMQTENIMSPEIDLSNKMTEAPKNQTDNIVIDTVYKSAEYCLCSDFGRLRYYDEESFYEHIHFWQQRNSTCDPDSIFSIYIDNPASSLYEVDTNVEIVDETPEECFFKICWSQIYDEHIILKKLIPTISDKEDDRCVIDVEITEIDNTCDRKVDKGSRSTEKAPENTTLISESKRLREAVKNAKSSKINLDENKTEDANNDENIKKEKKKENNKNVNKCHYENEREDTNNSTIGTKRRRSIRASKGQEDNSVDSIEPLSKRNVKCGVCSQNLASRDWERHASKEHGSIAWKAGDVFDFKDKNLIIKIKQKLTTDGILQCTFCDFNNRHCEEFLCHTEECVRNMMSKANVILPSTSTSVAITEISQPKKEKTTRLSKLLKCGVCERDVPKSDWIMHIGQEHNYIAWENGETPVKSNDEDQIAQHLHKIITGYGPLLCFKCKSGHQYGIKSIKKYLKHVRSCNKDNITLEESSKIETNTATANTAAKTDTLKSSKEAEKDIEITSLVQEALKKKSPKNLHEDTLTSPVSEKCEKRGFLKKKDGIIESDLTVSEKQKDNLDESTKKANIDTESSFSFSINKKNVKRDYSIKRLVKNKERDEKKDTVNSESTSTPSPKNKLSGKGNSDVGHILSDTFKDKIIQHRSDNIVDINIENSRSVVKEGTLEKSNTPVKGYTLPKNASPPIVREQIENCWDVPIKMEIENTSCSTAEGITVKCGVCKLEMNDIQWNDHIQNVHNYLAWKEGESSLDLEDKDQTWQHLHLISKQRGGLACAKCGLIRKYVKAYLNHIKQCDGMENATDASQSINVDVNDENTKTKRDKMNNSTKEVTSKNLDKASTSTHIVEEKTLKLNTEDTPSPSKQSTVKSGFSPMQKKKDIVNSESTSTPSPKNKLSGKGNSDVGHILSDTFKDKIIQHKSDNIVDINIENSRSVVKEETLEKSNTPVKGYTLPKNASTPIVREQIENCWDVPIKMEIENTSCSTAEGITVKCGVCKLEMNDIQWNDHIQNVHNYLAWKEGESSLDLEDKDQTWQHLHLISKQRGGLACVKCGLIRKYVKAYLNHIKQCDGMENATDASQSINVDVNDENTKTKRDKMNNSTKEVTSKNLDKASTSTHIVEEKTLKLNTEVTPSPSKQSTVKSGFSPMQVDSDRGSISTPITEEVLVKCGVCKQEMDDRLWNNHMQKAHDYLAWKDGENPLDLQDKEQVWQHLHSISKKCDGLVCSKCGLNRKYVKAYLGHKKQCEETATNHDSLTTSFLDTSSILNMTSSQMNDDFSAVVNCGVCSESCNIKNWIIHIQMKHDYLAWKEGEPKLDLQDEEAIENHLRGIIKEQGNIFCGKCGVDRKYGARAVHKYLRHIETCGKYIEIEVENDEIQTQVNSSILSQNVMVKCGVCEQDIEKKQWIEHIEKQHNYLAWKYGEPPLELENDECVKLHLSKLSKHVDGFQCPRCSFRKKYPKLYLDHIKVCNVTLAIGSSTSGLVECAVCTEKMENKQWRSHAMEKHYNLAWRVGEHAIDLKSPYAVEKYLKEYKQEVKVLECKVCGIIRASVIGFYAHVLVCGKSEEELEEYHNICEICNKPYVCVYKNQHMAAHREQTYALERKKFKEEKQKEENEKANESLDTTGEENAMGRRRAAVKARNVIEKLKIEEDDQRTCKKCGFEAGTPRKLAKHKCVTETFGSKSDLEGSSETSETEPETSPAEEEEEEEEEEAEIVHKRIRKKETTLSTKLPFLPFKYKEVKSYTEQNEEDFFKLHYTDEVLFSEWLDCNHKHLEDCQTLDYMPKIKQSCNIKISDEWETFERFEVKTHKKGCTMFVGGAVKCLSWVPSRLDEDELSRNYLAVSCHMDKDTPRLNYDELISHPGVIQFWDFNNFNNVLPKLVMCIAHDYGTVWAMDWCPSGARIASEGGETPSRLGLLALATSAGSVHILSVPYPLSEPDKIFIKLTSVAELRISMSSERKVYQATAVSWSKQKGHAIIMVGYSDGTIALYDLSSPSPLLKCVENGITIYYPYFDKRDHNVSITGVDICPFGEQSKRGLTGALCSASVSGSSTLLRPRAGQPRLDARSPATACRFSPGWPAVLVAADDSIATQAPNELDWYGCGRKWGPTCALGGCARCGRVLVYSRPLLRHFGALPPYADLKKQTIATLKTMPFSAKKRKITNDKLAMLVEPLTYDDVVTQYGVEVVLFSGKNAPVTGGYREPFSERYPLADVTAVAFCASRRHHRRAAVGVHAGFVLLLTI